MTYELRSATWDKYLMTDIDELTLFFDNQAEEHEVGEFDVPGDERHMVFLCRKTSNRRLCWVSVVNPIDVYENETPTLPNIKIQVKDKIYTLKEIIDILVIAK